MVMASVMRVTNVLLADERTLMGMHGVVFSIIVQRHLMQTN